MAVSAATRMAAALGLMTAFLPAAPAAAGERALLDTTDSRFSKMHMVDLPDVRWTGGFWGERFDVCREAMLPHVWSMLSDEQRCHAWANFEVAAGVGAGRGGAKRHHGPSFADGDVYKWLEAAASVLALTRDPRLERQLDDVIAVIARAQREDGYLHTETIIRQRLSNDADARPFQDRLNFETYNFGHLMTAACIHHRATGKRTLLDVARKACDYLDEFHRRASPELARSTICPSHYMGLIEMYRTTGDERYRTLVARLIDIRGSAPDGTDDNQDRVPFREMREAVGHAVRANYLYAGVADVYVETGDATLLRTLETLWESVVRRKMYVTGATGALYDGVSPYGSSRHNDVQRTHQSYGHDYQLPGITAYTESCATVGQLLWNWRMLLATGDAKYADVLERALYNGLLASVSLDGRSYFYVNPLRTVEKLSLNLRWSRRRQGYYSSFCCPPNIVRTIAQVSNYVYSTSKDSLWVHLYGASALNTRLVDGGRIRLRQETDYPWDGRIRLMIDEAPGREIAVMLRIPGWAHANGKRLRVNGEAVPGELVPGTYHQVKRAWKAGDVLELELPMPVDRLEAHPHAEEQRNQIAVQRGPIVYCLEGHDIPAGATLDSIALKADAPPSTPRKKVIAGTEVVALETTAWEFPARPWRDELYRRIDSSRPREITVTLIPYYAWANREERPMSVWLPVR